MKISIVTVVYNGAETIADCMRSVRSQRYEEIEHIVVDGGSIDGTLDIVERYGNPMTKVISGPDGGIYDAMNKGIALATGEVVGTLNADDYYCDGEVVPAVAEKFRSMEVDACYGDLIYVDRMDTNRVVRRWKSSPFDRRLFYSGWMPPHPTFFVRRSVYKRYGVFNTLLGSAADYELMLRFLLKEGVRAEYIPKTLVVMRAGGVSNRSLLNRIRANRNDRKAWRVNGLTPYPWTLLMKPLSKVGQYFGGEMR